MSYVVLARKWRSAQFSDIVGQTNIVRTLMNAIRTGRIHQAYLFTGSRGIGKTSIARIFAKVVRCENTRTEKVAAGARQGEEWLRSCDECASCKEVAAGSSVDVIEIDGASNNGVDAVREIRESAKYLPSSGSRKIYIIDEVHMLTTAAFNALLKTLEEPPRHVIFIFATTEPHKIPATILSRVQRFDFRRITSAQAQEHLQHIAKAEGIDADPGALALVGRAAEGSMRDALSLLDQVIAFSGNRVTVDHVRQSIGLIESQTILGILRHVFSRKPVEALALVDETFQQGHDLRVLTRSLLETLHAVILAKVGAASPNTIELSPEEWEEIRELTRLRELEELELIFQVLHHGLEWVARSPQPKIVLDVLLVKCASADALVRLDQAGGQAASGSPTSNATTGTPAPRMGAGVPPRGAHSAAAPLTANPPQANFCEDAPTRGGHEGRSPSSEPVSPPREDTHAGRSPSPGPAHSAPPPTNLAPRALTWPELIAHFRSTRPRLAALLEHASSSRMPTPEDSVLEVIFNEENSFKAEQLQSRELIQEITQFMSLATSAPVRVSVSVRKDVGESAAQRRLREERENEDRARTAVQNHPIIREAKALFGGELSPVERERGAPSATGASHER